MTYMFEVPDDWNLNHCFVKFDKGKLRIDRPVDHCIFEVAEPDLIKTSITKDYYDTLHERVAKCVSKLREHFNLGYIVDTCGGIQALEITTNELMRY